jgi:hypothetical protein
MAASAAMTLNPKSKIQNQKPIEVTAYYFPNYHPDARNDRWHGKGWTEWELVKAARPRFPGHRQPIVPAWGYFDEADPKWAAREIDLAADHGLTTFLYDWYWYEDGPYLQDGLEKGFLQAANNRRMKFALMWANHDWTNIHPATFTNKPETLAKGRVTRDAFEKLTDHVVRTYFSRPNYFRIDGTPYFSIYEMGTFIAGLGGLPQAKEALQSFRKKAQAAGHPGLHLNGILWGVRVLPSEIKLTDPNRVITELGLSSVGSYTWVHYYDPNSDGFPKGSYAKAAERNYALWEEHRKSLPVPYHINVTMGWDSSPRTVQTDTFESRGYPWTAVLEGNTPAAFKVALSRAKAFVSRPEIAQKIVTINAWNEWTEGSYLLPDKANGTAYLKAIREVFGTRRGE